MDMEFIETWSVSNVEKNKPLFKKGDWFTCDYHYICDFFEILIVGREINLAANERERERERKGGGGELIIRIVHHLSFEMFFLLVFAHQTPLTFIPPLHKFHIFVFCMLFIDLFIYR